MSASSLGLCVVEKEWLWEVLKGREFMALYKKEAEGGEEFTIPRAIVFQRSCVATEMVGCDESVVSTRTQP